MTACPKPPVHAKDAGFLKWLRQQPCLVCKTGVASWNIIESAHIESCRYGDAENAVPLHGLSCHREGTYALHRIGRENFERVHGVDLVTAAKAYYEQYCRAMGRDVS